MQSPESTFPAWRQPGVTDGHVPELLQTTLSDLEHAKTSKDVWDVILQLASTVRLPYVDLVYAPSERAEAPPSVRKNYKSDWLDHVYAGSGSSGWRNLRLPLSHGLSPTLTGLNFQENHPDLTVIQQRAYEAAANNGLASSFAIPVAMHVPPYQGTLTFSGEASRREVLAILRAHGWALQTVALTGFTKLIIAHLNEFKAGANMTDKQADILRLLGRGMKDREISDCLGVTVSAVRQRMTALSNNTGLQSRAELAALAMSLGLLGDPTQPQFKDASIVKPAQRRGSGWGIRRAQTRR